jgi:hypothetical protein
MRARAARSLTRRVLRSPPVITAILIDMSECTTVNATYITLQTSIQRNSELNSCLWGGQFLLSPPNSSGGIITEMQTAEPRSGTPRPWSGLEVGTGTDRIS